jgi:hypothetical protein
MRDDEGDRPLLDSANGVASPSRTQDSAIANVSFSTDQAENIALGGAIRSIGSKLSLQRGAKFREGMGNGLRIRVHPEGRPQTQNKKRKPYYEKSKHSVQSDSATLEKHGTSPRLPCGRVYLGTQSGISPRPGAVQWNCLGVR